MTETAAERGRNTNVNLRNAREAKNDEYYTQLSTIERELKHYRKHFAGKVVYCNCDDPSESQFFHYFSHNFEKLKLKKLMTTCYKSQDRDLFSKEKSAHAIWLEYTGDKSGNRVPDIEEIGVHPLQGDGSYDSPECLALLDEADIVVTNPPWSRFRDYLAQLVENDKKFIVLGNKSAVTYKETFPLIQQGKVWIGNTPMGAELVFNVSEEFGAKLVASGKTRSYTIVDSVVKGRAQACWYTNLDFAKRHEDLLLYKKYSPDEYPTYVNLDAIDVDRVDEIPIDYDGLMGVPISFLGKHNPGQFEIVANMDDHSMMPGIGVQPLSEAFIAGYRSAGGTGAQRAGGYWIGLTDPHRFPFKRILIRRKK